MHNVALVIEYFVRLLKLVSEGMGPLPDSYPPIETGTFWADECGGREGGREGGRNVFFFLKSQIVSLSSR